MWYRRLLSAAGTLLVLGFPSRGHGIECAVDRVDAIAVLHCTYDSGTAASGAGVQVFGPAETEEPYQVSQTDRSGAFAFVAREAGSWHVVVDDGMGHREEVLVLVEGSGAAAGESVVQAPPRPGETEEHLHETPASAVSKTYEVLFGLSLIWALAATFYAVKVRRAGKEAQAA